MLTIKSVGIFIEETTLNLAVVSRGLLELKVFDFLALEEVFSRPVSEVKEIVRQFLQKNHARKCHAVLNLPRTDLIVRQIELPLDPGANLAQIVEYQVNSLIPSNEEEICYGYWTGKPAKEGEKWTLTISLVLKSRLDRYLSLCDALGLRVFHVAPTSYALSRFCQMVAPRLKKIPALFMQQTVGGIEFVRQMPGRMAGSAFHAVPEEGAIAELILAEAEQFRTQAALGEEGSVPVYAIGPIAVPAFAPDSRMVLYKWQSPSDWPLKTVVSGSLFDQFKKNLPAMIAACSGLGRFPVSVDLLPAERRKKHSRWVLIPTYVLAGINVLIILALAMRGPVQFRKYSDLLTGEVTRLEPEVRKMRTIEEKMRDLERRSTVINQFKKGNAQLLAALRELSVILPSDSWIMDFSCRNNTFEIYGISNSATSLPQLIDNSPLFMGSEFVAPVARDSNGKEVFRIRMRLEGVEPAPSKASSKDKE